MLLHPGGVDARTWAPNLDAITAQFRALTPERRGHGHTPDVEGPIGFELMAQDTIEFLETVVGGPAHLVGCSDGATVALLVPGTSHGLVVEKPALCNTLIVDFLTTAPVRTMAPIRRA